MKELFTSENLLHLYIALLMCIPFAIAGSLASIASRLRNLAQIQRGIIVSNNRLAAALNKLAEPVITGQNIEPSLQFHEQRTDASPVDAGRT